MHIFLLRHGIAASLSAGGARTDEERPLTDAGREKLAQACQRYASHLPALDRIVCSPLLRARQSAGILAEATRYSGTVDQSSALEPGARPTAILDHLQGDALEGLGAVALVGHEPHLGNLLGLLLTGSEQLSLPFQQGMLSGTEIIEPRSMLGRLVLCLSQASMGNPA